MVASQLFEYKNQVEVKAVFVPLLKTMQSLQNFLGHSNQVSDNGKSHDLVDFEQQRSGEYDNRASISMQIEKSRSSPDKNQVR